MTRGLWACAKHELAPAAVLARLGGRISVGSCGEDGYIN